jgi:hypothetical protein
MLIAWLKMQLKESARRVQALGSLQGVVARYEERRRVLSEQ